MRLTLVSRASALARLQSQLVADALTRAHPDLNLTLATRSSSGDRDATSPLSHLTEKGAFTADLSHALLDGGADLAVHSWKDLPLDPPPGTRIAATLERADPRDLLLVRADAERRRPRVVTVLTCSPRRAWLARQVLPLVLPWPVQEVRTADVRGNIPTRLRKLVDGDAEALIVAKAAIDRLLAYGEAFDRADRAARACLSACRWMVMPMREWPWAPAQGAIAIEVADRRTDLQERLRAVSHQPTWDAVAVERRILGEHGGGCHDPLGAAVIARDYGRIVSIRAGADEAGAGGEWRLEHLSPAFPRASAARVWPRPGEDMPARRTAIDAAQPDESTGLWIARAEALPDAWQVSPRTLVWTAGMRTWQRLASRGIWVNGCADSLGDREEPRVDLLADRAVRWIRLTHAGAADDGALATYTVETSLPEDLPDRTHFYWTSGQQFRQALQRWPGLRSAFHASGPGRTWTTLRDTLGETGHAAVWLDRDAWFKDVVA